MSSLKGNTAIYLFSNIAASAVPFLLLPVLTRYLGAEGYGVVAMYTTFITLLGAFVGLSVHGAISRRWFDKDEIDISEYVSSCLLILLVSSSVLACFLFLFDNSVSQLTSVPVSWLYVGILVSTSSFVIQIRLGLWQVQGFAKKYGVLQVLSAVFNGLVSLLLVVHFLKGLDGRLWGISLTFVVFGFISIFWLYLDGFIKLKARRDYLIDALKFGVPLIPHVLGAFLLLMADRFIINDNLGPKSVGIYMVAVQISIGLQLINEAFNKAFVPWLFEHLKINSIEGKIKIVKITYSYFAVLILAIPVSYVFSPFIVELLAGPEFKDADEILPLLILAQVFHGMYYLVTNYLFYERKTHITASVTLLCGSIGVFLTWWLVSIYGLIGAGVGAAVSMFLQFVITWIMANKVHPMPWLKFYKLA